MESVSLTCSGRRCGFTVTERVKSQVDFESVDEFAKITKRDLEEAEKRAAAHIRMHELSCQFMPAKLCPEASGMSKLQIKTHLESCPDCLGGLFRNLHEQLDEPEVYFE